MKTISMGFSEYKQDMADSYNNGISYAIDTIFLIFEKDKEQEVKLRLIELSKRLPDGGRRDHIISLIKTL